MQPSSNKVLCKEHNISICLVLVATKLRHFLPLFTWYLKKNVSSRVRIWAPSTSASVKMMILWYRRFSFLKSSPWDKKDNYIILSVCFKKEIKQSNNKISTFTPSPRPRIKFWISSFLYIAASSLLSMFKILPLRGRIACNNTFIDSICYICDIQL